MGDSLFEGTLLFTKWGRGEGGVKSDEDLTTWWLIRNGTNKEFTESVYLM